MDLSPKIVDRKGTCLFSPPCKIVLFITPDTLIMLKSSYRAKHGYFSILALWIFSYSQHVYNPKSKDRFTQNSFFVRFCPFFFSMKKYVFFPHFFCVHIRTNQIVTYWTTVLQKNFCKGVQLYFEISLSSFVHKLFEQILAIQSSLLTVLNANMDLHKY